MGACVPQIGQVPELLGSDERKTKCKASSSCWLQWGCWLWEIKLSQAKRDKGVAPKMRQPRGSNPTWYINKWSTPLHWSLEVQLITPHESPSSVVYPLLEVVAAPTESYKTRTRFWVDLSIAFPLKRTFPLRDTYRVVVENSDLRSVFFIRAANENWFTQPLLENKTDLLGVGCWRARIQKCWRNILVAIESANSKYVQ